MIRLPGAIHPGTVCEHPVALVDLPPTFFSFADVRLPWPMHGHNLRPILENPSSPWDYPVLLEHFAMSFGPDTDIGLTSGELFSDVPWWISLRKDHYKYIRTLEPNELEQMQARVKYDLDYLRQWSPSLDFRIIVKTLVMMFADSKAY